MTSATEVPVLGWRAGVNDVLHEDIGFSFAAELWEDAADWLSGVMQRAIPISDLALGTQLAIAEETFSHVAYGCQFCTVVAGRCFFLRPADFEPETGF
jgi:hypothetical protein